MATFEDIKMENWVRIGEILPNFLNQFYTGSGEKKKVFIMDRKKQHVSFFVWMLEFMLGFLVVLNFFVMPLNSSRGVDIVSLIFYTIVVPGAYLINDSDLKSQIVDSKFYILFANTVAHGYANQIIPRERNMQDP